MVAQLTQIGSPDQIDNHTLLCTFVETGSFQDLSNAIDVFQSAADTDSDRASYLSLLARARLLDFERFHNGLDVVDSAISAHMASLTLTPDSHPAKAERLFHFARALRARFNRSEEMNDIHDYIVTLRSAIELTRDLHAENLHFHELADAMEVHFDSLAELDVVELAVVAFKRAVSRCDESDPHKAAWLSNLGTALLDRFGRLHEVRDIEDAMAALRSAVSLTFQGHPQRPFRLYKFAATLLRRVASSTVNDNDEDIETAVASLRLACDITPNSDIEKPRYLDGLSTALRARFKRTGSTDDYNDLRIALHQAAACRLTHSPTHPSSLRILKAYAQPQWETLDDLEQISDLLEVFELLHEDYPEKQARLDVLRELWRRAKIRESKALTKTSGYERFLERKDRLSHLSLYPEIAVSNDLECIGSSALVREVIIAACRDLLPHSPKQVNDNSRDIQPTLSAKVHATLELLESSIDKWEWIRTMRRVIASTPAFDVDRSALLGHLRHALLAQASNFNEDIQVTAACDALNSAAESDDDLLERLDGLGRLIHLRAGLEQVAAQVEPTDPFAIVDEGMPIEPYRLPLPALDFLYDHASFLLSRFMDSGALGDLDTAVACFHRVVERTPAGHPKWATRLDSLANASQIRYVRLHNIEDLYGAIAASRRAVHVTPAAHPSRGERLELLGKVMRCRFEELGDKRDIQDAARALEAAVECTSDNDPGTKAARLNALSRVYASSFQRLRESERTVGEVEMITSTSRRALQVNQDDDREEEAISLNDLGAAYHLRYECSSDIDDLNEAIHFARQAADLAPRGDPSNALALNNLGYFIKLRFNRLHDAVDFENAVEAFMKATRCALSPSTGRAVLDSAWNCAQMCQENLRLAGRVRLLEAYQIVFSTIPYVAWRGHDVQRRYAELADIGNMVNSAVAAAIEAGHMTQAVQWFEEGRGIVWRQALQLRVSHPELQARYPDIADQLQQATSALANATEEDGAQMYRALVSSYEKLVDEIRCLDGFHNYLQQQNFKELTSAADDGPIILLNVHEIHCDALIIWPSANISHIPLPLLTSKLAKTLRSKIVSSFRIGARYRGDLAQSQSGGEKASLRQVLKILWSHVVQPILCAVEGELWNFCKDDIPHVTWCATGPLALLPLHAAGIYDVSDKAKNIRASDFVASSYTPSLTTLSHLLHRSVARPLCQLPNILAIAQPDTPGLNAPLFNTVAEAEVIQHHFPTTATVLSDKNATVEIVGDALAHYDWVHFACHASQNLKDPTRSAFALHDGKLNLSQLMTVSLDRAELAILSACETATGDEELPEEGVHLAAGMLAAGFRSTVATMWSIADEDGPIVAHALYAQLKQKQITQGRLGVAHALRNAVECLKEEIGEHNFQRWAPFAHFGV